MKKLIIFILVLFISIHQNIFASLYSSSHNGKEPETTCITRQDFSGVTTITVITIILISILILLLVLKYKVYSHNQFLKICIYFLSISSIMAIGIIIYGFLGETQADGMTNESTISKILDYIVVLHTYCDNPLW